MSLGRWSIFEWGNYLSSQMGGCEGYATGWEHLDKTAGLVPYPCEVLGQFLWLLEFSSQAYYMVRTGYYSQCSWWDYNLIASFTGNRPGLRACRDVQFVGSDSSLVGCCHRFCSADREKSQVVLCVQVATICRPVEWAIQLWVCSVRFSDQTTESCIQ